MSTRCVQAVKDMGMHSPALTRAVSTAGTSTNGRHGAIKCEPCRSSGFTGALGSPGCAHCPAPSLDHAHGQAECDEGTRGQRMEGALAPLACQPPHMWYTAEDFNGSHWPDRGLGNQTAYPGTRSGGAVLVSEPGPRGVVRAVKVKPLSLFTRFRLFLPCVSALRLRFSRYCRATTTTTCGSGACQTPSTGPCACCRGTRAGCGTASLSSPTATATTTSGTSTRTGATLSATPPSTTAGRASRGHSPTATSHPASATGILPCYTRIDSGSVVVCAHRLSTRQVGLDVRRVEAVPHRPAVRGRAERVRAVLGARKMRPAERARHQPAQAHRLDGRRRAGLGLPAAPNGYSAGPGRHDAQAPRLLSVPCRGARAPAVLPGDRGHGVLEAVPVVPQRGL